MASILIIEDKLHNMKLAVFLLESVGHRVLQAKDATAGIALAKQHRPDLVLMDIQLPDMDGLTAVRALKDNHVTSNIKIFALTAFAMKEDEENILAAGCNGYIAKPIRYKHFLETINSALLNANPEETVKTGRLHFEGVRNGHAAMKNHTDRR
jgi:two-component system cell cycle response regulator DivK